MQTFRFRDETHMRLLVLGFVTKTFQLVWGSFMDFTEVSFGSLVGVGFQLARK